MQVRRRRGSSFLEIVTVMTMLGVVMAIAMPRVRAVPRQADLSAIQLSLAVEQAQRTALARQFDVLLSVDSAGRRVRIAEDANGNGSIDAGERTRWIPLATGASFVEPPFRVGGLAPAGAVAGSGLIEVGGLPSLVMRRDGSASVSAELYLRQAGAGTELRAVAVSRATARAEWYRFDGNRWLSAAP